MAQPTLNELMTRYLATRAPLSTQPEGSVEPHEVIGGFRASPTVTWSEALAAFRILGVTADKVPMPPEWAALATQDSDAVLVPLAVGLFPQRVRTLPSLSDIPKPTAPRFVPGFTSLRAWMQKALQSGSPTQLILVSGIATLLGDRATAFAALSAAEPLCIDDWKPVWDNQYAAVSFLFGEASPCQGQASPMTQAVCELAQPNRSTSSTRFAEAIRSIPEDSGWKHLAQMYQFLGQ